MSFSMTRFTQSYTVGYFISKFYKRCKRLDVVRMNFNSTAVAFVVMCAAILTGVIVSLVNSRPPLIIFWVSSSQFILMTLWWVIYSLGYVCFGGCDRSNGRGYGFSTTHQRTIFSFPAFFFIFRHGLMAIKTIGFYLHTAITHAFYFCLYSIRREATFANETSCANEMSISVEMRSTSPASIYGLLPLFGNAWCWFAAVGTWLKSLFVTRLTNPIIPSVVFTYLTSIFHVSILPQVTNEYNYE